MEYLYIFIRYETVEEQYYKLNTLLDHGIMFEYGGGLCYRIATHGLPREYESILALAGAAIVTSAVAKEYFRTHSFYCGSWWFFIRTHTQFVRHICDETDRVR